MSASDIPIETDLGNLAAAADIYAFAANAGVGPIDGSHLTRQTTIANLMKTWSPLLYLFGGNNSYPTGNTGDLNSAWSLWTAQITAKTIYPGYGRHENDNLGVNQKVKFPYVDQINRYFSVTQNQVTFYFLDAGLNSALALTDPIGNDPASDQIEWLQAQLAISKTHWNIVVIPEVGWSSVTGAAITNLRWPWRQLIPGREIDLVICGGPAAYERLLVDGTPIINAGNGGADLTTFGTLDPNSLVQALKYGALKLSVFNDILRVKAYDLNGYKFDDLTIKKARPEQLSYPWTSPTVQSSPSSGSEGSSSIPYVLPVATASVLGGVIIGSGINVAMDGTISVSFPSSGVVSVAGKVGVVTLVSTDITGFVAAVQSAAQVKSVAGRTGVITLSATDISGFNAAASAAAPVQSVAGRTGAVTLSKTDVGLSAVENTALSTWAGTSNITVVGTIAGALSVTGVINANGGLNLTGALTLHAPPAIDKTITAPGTTGNQTINKPCGSVNFASGPTSLVVTNSFCTVNSLIFLSFGANNAEQNYVSVVASSGFFTLTLQNTSLAELRVNFFIVN